MKSAKESAEQKLEELSQTLDTVLAQYQENPVLIAEALEWKIRHNLYSYSVNNSILIESQNPHVTYAASYKKWQDNGYQVQKGQQGLKVLVPVKASYFFPDSNSKKPKRLKEASRAEKEKIKSGELKLHESLHFRVGYVFDVSQTDCPKEDYPKLYHTGYSSEEHAELYEHMKAYAQENGISVLEQDVSSISLRGQANPDDKQIRINHLLDDTEKLSTLTHELGHILLHAGNPDKPLSLVECEADAVSILSQTELGILITDSRKYHFAKHFEACENLDGFSAKSLIRDIQPQYMKFREPLMAYLEKNYHLAERSVQDMNTNLKQSKSVNEYQAGDLLTLDVDGEKIYFVAKNDHELYQLQPGHNLTEVRNNRKDTVIISAVSMPAEETGLDQDTIVYPNRIVQDDGVAEFQYVGVVSDESIQEINRLSGNMQEIQNKSGNQFMERRSLEDSMQEISDERQFYQAIESNDGEKVDRLLQKGINPNITRNWDAVPITYAAVKEADQAADALLRNGAYVDSIDRQGKTAVKISAEQDDYQTTRVLLQHQADTSDLELETYSPEIQKLIQAHTKNRTEETTQNISASITSPNVTLNKGMKS